MGPKALHLFKGYCAATSPARRPGARRARSAAEGPGGALPPSAGSRRRYAEVRDLRADYRYGPQTHHGGLLNQFELPPDLDCLFKAARQCPLGASLEDMGVGSHDWLQVCRRDRGGGKPPQVEGDAIAALTTMLHNQGADKSEADNFARAVMPPRSEHPECSGQQRRSIPTRLSVLPQQPQSNCRILAPALSQHSGPAAQCSEQAHLCCDPSQSDRRDILVRGRLHHQCAVCAFGPGA